MKNISKKFKNKKGITFIEAIINIYVYVLLITVCVMISVTYVKSRIVIRQKQQAIEELSAVAGELGKKIRMSECDPSGCLPGGGILAIQPNDKSYDSIKYRIAGGELRVSVNDGAYELMMESMDGEFSISRNGSGEIPLITIKFWKLDKHDPSVSINGAEVKTSVSMRSGY